MAAVHFFNVVCCLSSQVSPTASGNASYFLFEVRPGRRKKRTPRDCIEPLRQWQRAPEVTQGESVIELGPCELTGVFGPMASGKTWLIDQWVKEQPRFVLFDVTGESCDDPTIEHVWSSPARLWERLKANPYMFRIAYHPGPDIELDFNYAIRCLWRVKTFKLLVCDEFHEVCGVSDTPGYVRTMMRYARHDHLALIGASQRIADVSKLFTSGCRNTILFWTQEARDLDAVADRWGSAAADTVRNLRPLIYNDKTKTTKQIPQCLVCPKSGSPRVFDFAKDDYVTAGRPELEISDTEVPNESDQLDAVPQPITDEPSRELTDAE